MFLCQGAPPCAGLFFAEAIGTSGWGLLFFGKLAAVVADFSRGENMSQARWRWGWVVLVLLATACSGMLKKPEIELAGVELAGLSLVEQRFVLKFKVRNPNALELVVKRLDFSVDLEGRPFGQGNAMQPVRVPANGEAILDVTVTGSLKALLERARVARNEGREKMAYRIFGSVDLENAGVLSFERKGELPSFCATCAPARGRSGSSSEDKPL